MLRIMAITWWMMSDFRFLVFKCSFQGVLADQNSLRGRNRGTRSTLSRPWLSSGYPKWRRAPGGVILTFRKTYLFHFQRINDNRNDIYDPKTLNFLSYELNNFLSTLHFNQPICICFPQYFKLWLPFFSEFPCDEYGEESFM